MVHVILSYTLLDQFLGIEGRDWNKIYLEMEERQKSRMVAKEEKLRSERHLNTTASLPLTDYVGTYSSLSSGPAKITLNDSSLFFDYNVRHRGPLEHWHHDTFRVHWINPISDMEPVTFLQFRLNPDGNVQELTVKFYDPLTFIRE